MYLYDNRDKQNKQTDFLSTLVENLEVNIEGYSLGNIIWFDINGH